MLGHHSVDHIHFVRRLFGQLLHYFPNNAFQSIFCALRFRPALLVGIPVAFEIFRLTLDTPNARFQLNPPKDTTVYLQSGVLLLICGFSPTIIAINVSLCFGLVELHLSVIPHPRAITDRVYGVAPVAYIDGHIWVVATDGLH